MIVYNYPSFFGVFSEMFSSFAHSLDKTINPGKTRSRANATDAEPRQGERNLKLSRGTSSTQVAANPRNPINTKEVAQQLNKLGWCHARDLGFHRLFEVTAFSCFFSTRLFAVCKNIVECIWVRKFIWTWCEFSYSEVRKPASSQRIFWMQCNTVRTGRSAWHLNRWWA